MSFEYGVESDIAAVQFENLIEEILLIKDKIINTAIPEEVIDGIENKYELGILELQLGSSSIFDAISSHTLELEEADPSEKENIKTTEDYFYDIESSLEELIRTFANGMKVKEDENGCYLETKRSERLDDTGILTSYSRLRVVDNEVVVEDYVYRLGRSDKAQATREAVLSYGKDLGITGNAMDELELHMVIGDLMTTRENLVKLLRMKIADPTILLLTINLMMPSFNEGEIVE